MQREYFQQVKITNFNAASAKYMFNICQNLVKYFDIANNYIWIGTTKNNLIPLTSFLKNHEIFLFKTLTDIVVYDVPGKKNRFSLVYNLFSDNYNSRIFINLQVSEGSPVNTLFDLFKCADWLERESFDMFGVYFVNHPNFRRILTDYGFRGHPLRKDFPVSGFYELFFDSWVSETVYQKIELVQEYRNFDFPSPWSKKSFIN